MRSISRSDKNGSRRAKRASLKYREPLSKRQEVLMLPPLAQQPLSWESSVVGNLSQQQPTPSICSRLKKGTWTDEEDRTLVDYICKHGEVNWNTVEKESGFNLCMKSSCKLCWINHLRPDLKKGPITAADEIETIVLFNASIANKWSRIAEEETNTTQAPNLNNTVDEAHNLNKFTPVVEPKRYPIIGIKKCRFRDPKGLFRDPERVVSGPESMVSGPKMIVWDPIGSFRDPKWWFHDPNVWFLDQEMQVSGP
ncbi:transcription factor MYB1-like [Impatiens glandulifera]|uniref:transcription factor MYB1-like n=1 Tax=Impatiens glandulifera TaxID=253017 RepID=UPI001FB11274|nr:transcription factor MYB1-like [Impatiens glandulifera]